MLSEEDETSYTSSDEDTTPRTTDVRLLDLPMELLSHIVSKLSWSEVADSATFVSRRMFFACRNVVEWPFIDLNSGTKGIDEMSALCNLASNHCLRITLPDKYCSWYCRRTDGEGLPLRFFDLPFRHSWNKLTFLEVSPNREPGFSWDALGDGLASNSLPSLETLIIMPRGKALSKRSNFFPKVSVSDLRFSLLMK